MHIYTQQQQQTTQQQHDHSHTKQQTTTKTTPQQQHDHYLLTEYHTLKRYMSSLVILKTHSSLEARNLIYDFMSWYLHTGLLKHTCE